MTYENLRLLRNMLYRTLAVGCFIVLFLAGMTFGSWETFMTMASSLFHADPTTLTPVILKFFMTVRFFLLFIILTPALAIHWTLKKEKNLK